MAGARGARIGSARRGQRRSKALTPQSRRSGGSGKFSLLHSAARWPAPPGGRVGNRPGVVGPGWTAQGVRRCRIVGMF